MTKRKGVTLIEVLFVLGIMAILLGIIMMLYSQSREKKMVNDFITECNLIINASGSLYANAINSGRSDAISSVLVSSGMIPNKYIKNGQLISPNGGNIGVNTNMYGGQLVLYIDTLDKTTCSLLATNLWGTSENIHDLHINSSTFTHVSSFSPKDINNACIFTNNNVIWINYMYLNQ